MARRNGMCMLTFEFSVLTLPNYEYLSQFLGYCSWVSSQQGSVPNRFGQEVLQEEFRKEDEMFISPFDRMLVAVLHVFPQGTSKLDQALRQGLSLSAVSLLVTSMKERGLA